MLYGGISVKHRVSCISILSAKARVIMVGMSVNFARRLLNGDRADTHAIAWAGAI